MRSRTGDFPETSGVEGTWALLNRYVERSSRHHRLTIAISLAVAAGSALAFFISLSRPYILSVRNLVEPYFKINLPTWALWRACVVLFCLTLIAVLRQLPQKIWRSLRLGLVPFQGWLWALSVAVFWLALESCHAPLAWGSIGLALLLTAVGGLVARGSAKNRGPSIGFIEPDGPVQEDGEDLLGRRGIIDRLVSTIVQEEPEVIAVTGEYGEGKTSFLNLLVGELRKVDREDRPIIVRFSPWLAADSNALVLSLLNSIVVEMKEVLVVPGLGRDAARYGRTLLSAIPKAEWLKELVADPSQQQRIEALADHISRTERRVLVVLDDVDRMEAKELETVFKLLKGSDRLSNITFLCAFSKKELASILEATRPSQDTLTFIEKFFPVECALPKIEASQLWVVFSQGITNAVGRSKASHRSDLATSLDSIWRGGASVYFRNLRTIKLFLNKINFSLALIPDEVNVEDLVRLELIRDVSPDLYVTIYDHKEHFWKQSFAFETRFRGDEPVDEKEAKKWHAEFFKKLEDSVPTEKQYVFRFFADLFPDFAEFSNKSFEGTTPWKAEMARRIFHPRCFAQYFTLKTPSQLFPRGEFAAFISSLKSKGEDEVVQQFNETYRSIVSNDFKKWHFMHLVENNLSDLNGEAQRGLCRGMAENSALWQGDAFELLIAINSTRDTLLRTADSNARKRLLRSIVTESASDYYTLALLRRLEYDLNSALSEGKQYQALGFGPEDSNNRASLLSDLQEIKDLATKHVRDHYLGPGAPSVFEQFSGLGSGVDRIEPNAFLFNWQYLGPEARVDERKYLYDLLKTRPRDLNEFLKLMFRVDFIDDYGQLKPLIDYKDLYELVNLHESSLDHDKVEKFRGRYLRDQETPPK